MAEMKWERVKRFGDLNLKFIDSRKHLGAPPRKKRPKETVKED